MPPLIYPGSTRTQILYVARIDKSVMKAHHFLFTLTELEITIADDRLLRLLLAT